MAARTNSQYVVAAIWLLAGLAIAVVIFAAVGNQLESFKAKNIYRAEFLLTDGAAGLKPGSVVRIGGQDFGRVEKLQLDDQVFPTKIFVDFSLPKSIVLYMDPAAPATEQLALAEQENPPAGYDKRGRRMNFRLEQPILGSGSVINLTSVGWPKDDRSNILQPEMTMKPEGHIKGVPAPGLLAQAGIEKKDIDKLKLALGDFQATVSRVRGDYETWRTDIDEGVKRAKGIVVKVDDIVTENRENIKTTIAEGPKVMKKFNDGIDDARSVIADAKKAWPEWQANVSSTLRNADEFVKTLNPDSGKLYKQVVETINDGREGLKKFDATFANLKGVSATAQTILDESAPEIRQILASSRLASDQLKLTLAEVRRNPWKMLYQPGRKELQQDLLFMASRNYADAVSDLRSASTSMESIIAAAKAGGRAIDEKEVTELREKMIGSFSKYEAAEKELLDRLVGERK